MTAIRRTFGLVLGAALATMATGASAANWEMDPAASKLRFEGSQTGSPFRGEFRRFSADITLDPQDLSTASITATIEVNSFASGSPDRDTDALDSDWFHTSSFPQATFTSDSVTHVDGNAYLATGVLAIKGIEHAVELPFTLDIEGDKAVAEGSIGLNRMDYRVGVNGEIEDDHFIGHAVSVTLYIEATRVD